MCKCKIVIMRGVTSCHEDVDCCLPGVAGVAGVVALVPRTGRHDPQLALRPVLEPANPHGPLSVVVDHLLVLVPENVLGRLVVSAQGNGAGQDDGTAVVDVELIRDASVVTDNNHTLWPVDV